MGRLLTLLRGKGAASGAYPGFSDPLLVQEHLSSHAGVVFSVNTPAKDAGNPIFPAGAHADTWDADKTYVSALKGDGVWHMFYKGATGGNGLSTCYAYSTDGVTWTRPNIGRVEYDGSTDNNMILPFATSWQFGSATYDATTGKWLVLMESAGVSDGVHIYQADEPDGPYTFVKTVVGNGEARDIVRRADGRWLAYRRSETPRDIYAFLSDTQSAAGAWTDAGRVLNSNDLEDQYYGLWADQRAGVLYGFVAHFNATTDLMWLDLYFSRDGLVWVLKATEWVPLGGTGTWDAGMVLGGSLFAEDGDDWHVYYSGSVNPHAGPVPRDSRIGRATIKKGRIGQAAGNGTLTTVNVAVAPDSALTVNVNAAGGSLNMEVQDQNGVPLPGFAEADFDTITADIVTATPTWGGLPMPTGRTNRLKFALSDAALHGYELSRAAPVSPQDISGLSMWLDASDQTTLTTNPAGSSGVWNWSDKSGNGRLLTQGNVEWRPLTGTRTLNGRNVVEYPEGVGTYVSRDDLAAGVTATWFFVFQNDGASQFAPLRTSLGSAFFAQSGSSSTSINSNVGTPELRVNGVAQTVTTRAQVHAAIGTAPVVITITSFTPVSSVYLTAHADPGSATDGIHGEILEYGRTLSLEEIETVEAYLMSKWGIA